MTGSVARLSLPRGCAGCSRLSRIESGHSHSRLVRASSDYLFLGLRYGVEREWTEYPLVLERFEANKCTE